MRLIVGLLVAWCLLVAVSGLWVQAVIRQAVRDWHADELQRAVNAVAEVSRSAHWSIPWESDPNWLALERRLDLALVPIYRTPNDASQSVEPTTNVEGAPAPHAPLFNTNVQWSEGHDGQWRVSVTIPVAADSQSSAVAISGTRAVTSAKIIHAWWWAWTISVALSSLAFAITICLRWRDARHWASRLSAWIKVTEQATPAASASLPPAVVYLQDAADRQLERVRSAVNSWLTELQQTSRRSGLVLGNMLEGVLAVDAHSRVWLVNSALSSMLEVSSDNYLMKPLVEVVRVPRVVQLVADVMSTLEMQEEVIEVGVAPRKFLRLRAYPLPLPATAHGVILTVRDETQLHQSELIRRDFVTNASHELKTPLAAIRAFAETLQLGALDDPPAAEKFVANIISQADRMNRLVQSMLQLARVQAETPSQDVRSFDAAATVQATIEEVTGLSLAKHVTVCLHSQSPTMLITSDFEAFQTIVSNLLSNAIRYTPPSGSVDVSLSLDERWFTLIVSDTGVGIPEEDQQRVFERFYRVEKDRNEKSGGTGLGLSIVKHLVQTLGGTISLTSRLNVGSSFQVRLPVID